MIPANHDFNEIYHKSSQSYHFPVSIYQLIDCLVETRNYSKIFLAFTASSFRVTGENKFESDLLAHPLSFECFHWSRLNEFFSYFYLSLQAPDFPILFTICYCYGQSLGCLHSLMKHGSLDMTMQGAH